MKKYTLPTETYEHIRLTREHYNNIINSNNIERLANESRGFITLNRKIRLEKNMPSNQIPSTRKENEMHYDIKIAERNNDIRGLKIIYTKMYNELIEALTYNNFKAKMLFKKSETTSIGEKKKDIWDVDKNERDNNAIDKEWRKGNIWNANEGEIEDAWEERRDVDRKKKIVKPKTRKPVKKCRCKKW